MGWFGSTFGFDDGQHRAQVRQLEWRRLALELGTFLAVLLAGRLLTGDDPNPLIRAVIVAVAIAAAVAVRRRRVSPG